MLLTIICVGGCFGKHDSAGHDGTVTFGEQNNKFVKQFDCLTPQIGKSHWISYYDGYGGTPTWNSFARLHDRYKLTMQFKISLDRRGHKFKIDGQPHFIVNEVLAVDFRGVGEGTSVGLGEQYSFGVGEWKTLVENDGDFSSIGIQLKKNSPVEGIEHVKQ